MQERHALSSSSHDRAFALKMQSLTCLSVLRPAVLRLGSRKHEAVSQSFQTADCLQVTDDMLHQFVHLRHDALNCKQ